MTMVASRSASIGRAEMTATGTPRRSALRMRSQRIGSSSLGSNAARTSASACSMSAIGTGSPARSMSAPAVARAPLRWSMFGVPTPLRKIRARSVASSFVRREPPMTPIDSGPWRVAIARS